VVHKNDTAIKSGPDLCRIIPPGAHHPTSYPRLKAFNRGVAVSLIARYVSFPVFCSPKLF
jgi:hypothetical protein